MRPAFLAAAARPFLRRYSPAFSMSPSTSTRAFLQSAIPAPVRSRSSLTMPAVTSATTYSSSFGNSQLLVFGCRRRFGRGGATAALRHLDPRSVATRGDVDDVVALTFLLAAAARHALALELGAEDRGVGDLRREELDRADRVVVPRDDVVDEVGVAVGVGHRDDRDLELARLGDGDVLLVRVDDEDRARELAHVLQAAQRLLELVVLALEAEDFLLVDALERAVLRHLLDGAHPVERALDRFEVGERPAQPAVGHVVIPAALRLLRDDVLGLLLGAHEEDALAARDRVDHEVVRLAEELDRVLEVDDVNAVPGAEDVRAHLGVPALGLVPEVHARFQELAHRDGGFRPGGLSDCLIHVVSLRFSTAPFTECPRPEPPATQSTLRGRE